MDGKDGHKRLTTGKNFALVGGSKETHEEMTEKAIKINEKLAKRGKASDEPSSGDDDDDGETGVVPAADDDGDDQGDGDESAEE